MNASALQLLLAVLAGWLDRQDRDVLRYLVEENRVLRRQLRGRRLSLTVGECGRDSLPLWDTLDQLVGRTLVIPLSV
jgi:hypothetical protein